MRAVVYMEVCPPLFFSCFHVGVNGDGETMDVLDTLLRDVGSVGLQGGVSFRYEKEGAVLFPEAVTKGYV